MHEVPLRYLPASQCQQKSPPSAVTQSDGHADQPAARRSTSIRHVHHMNINGLTNKGNGMYTWPLGFTASHGRWGGG